MNALACWRNNVLSAKFFSAARRMTTDLPNVFPKEFGDRPAGIDK
jgi:hypothetical protein